MREWKEASHNVWYYWTLKTGQVIGQINLISHTTIYTAKAIVDLTEEEPLGRYINSDFAKQAVETFWSMEDKTLSHKNQLKKNK